MSGTSKEAYESKSDEQVFHLSNSHVVHDKGKGVVFAEPSTR